MTGMAQNKKQQQSKGVCCPQCGSLGLSMQLRCIQSSTKLPAISVLFCLSSFDFVPILSSIRGRQVEACLQVRRTLVKYETISPEKSA